MTLAKASSDRPFGWLTVAEFLFAAVCGLALCFTALFFLAETVTGATAGTRDFVVYWATGQQLAGHVDPYDRDALLRIERNAGLPVAYNAMFMRNPPWTLPLTYPLGFVGLRVGSLLWSLLLMACLGLAVRLFWIMQGRPRSRLHWLGLTFGPALFCLIVGQTSVFPLLGIALFQYLLPRRPFLAGASLWLCMLKPHLFVPFGLVLLLWIALTRSYKVLAGGASAMASALGLVAALDPMAWSQYRHMLATSGIDRDIIPCPTFFFRIWTYPDAIWLQYLPMALACAWALAWFWKRRDTWDWRRDGSLLVLVSLIVAPYSWLFDQVLAIPALLHGAYRARSRYSIAALIFLSALIEIEFIGNTWNPSALYVWTLWTGPAWLLWYTLVGFLDRRTVSSLRVADPSLSQP